MATVEYLHICDYAFATDNKPCFIGIFKQIRSEVYPYVHPHFAVGIQLAGQPDEEAQIQIALARANGELVAQAAGVARLSPLGGAFVAMHFISVAFPLHGEYRIVVSSNNQHLATATIGLQQAPL